jgi:hypothetical protein
MIWNRLNLVGQRFGRLKVITDAGNKKQQSLWECLCDCGNTVKVTASCLRKGHTRSCGCLKTDIHTIHGQARRGLESRTYQVWEDIIRRCDNPKFKQYKDYGGRGIKIYLPWRKFENFYKDVGDIPEGMTFDRIDNDGDYEPGNWRLATRKEQASNRRTNRWIEHKGETKTLTQWADYLGIAPTTLRARLNKWSIERSLTAPVRKQGC